MILKKTDLDKAIFTPSRNIFYHLYCKPEKRDNFKENHASDTFQRIVCFYQGW